MRNYKKFEELIKNPVIKNAKKNSENKTIFEVTKYPYREKVSSNIFAFYFDINEEHNWQDIFLEAIFNAMNETYDNTYKLKVDTEFPTTKGNYIDIVLTGNDFVIGIENKINASLYNDLEDYYKTIKRIAEENKIYKIYAIVLSANKLSDLDTKKIEELKKSKITYKHILYSELFDKIDILLTEKNIKDNKWLIFYKELKKTIKKRNDKNMTIDENLKKFYNKNKEEIKNLTNCLYDLKEKLNKKTDKLKEEIEKKLNKENINQNNFVVGHWNYNQNINIFDNNNNLYTICNIDLKEYKITIDNVITPESWYIQIYTKVPDREKILTILKRNGIECGNSNDRNHIKLFKNYNDGSNEIIEKDIELIKIFDKELSSKNIKE